MKGRSDVRTIQYSTKPLGLIRRRKKGMITINRRIGAVGNIIDFSHGVRGYFTDSLQMGGDKYQAIRIDMTLIDEYPGFLRTSTRIAGIN